MSNLRQITMVIMVAYAAVVVCISVTQAGPSILKDTDLPGNDFRDFPVYAVFDMYRPGEIARYQEQLQREYERLADRCYQACVDDSECHAWTMKKVRDRANASGGVSKQVPWRIDGRCFLKTEASAPIRDYTCISGKVDREVPTVQATPQIAPGLEARTDRPGGDYREVPRERWEGADSCQQLCQRDAQCRAWTWVRPGVQGPNPRCYLKNTVPNPVQNDCCVSGVKSTDQTVPPPPSSGGRRPTPARTQPTLTQVQEQEPPGGFPSDRWEKGVDRQGGDYGNKKMPEGTDPGDCELLCQQDDRCRAWTWVQPGVKGNLAVCYLKETVGSPVVDEYCVSGVKRLSTTSSAIPGSVLGTLSSLEPAKSPPSQSVEPLAPRTPREPRLTTRDQTRDLSVVAPTPRNTAFLRTIETARSINEVRRALEEANLSRAEIEQLQLESHHVQRLESLAEAELRARPPRARSITANMVQLRERRQLELDREYSQRATLTNQSLAAELQRLQAPSRPGTRTTAKARPAVPLRVQKVEQPVITQRTPEQITYNPRGPVQRFIIEGRNFLWESGTAEFRFAGRTFPANVLEWSETWIELQVPEITGLMREVGSVVIRTRPGLEARTAVTYEPAIVTRLVDSRNCDFRTGSGCNRGGERGSGFFDVSCGPYFGNGHGDLRNDNPLWLLCLAGQQQEFPTRMYLQNGWTVFDAGYEQTGCYGWHGCGGWQGSGTRCGAYHDDPPVRGSRRINHTNIIWTDAFAQCEFAEQIIIEGPVGVPHSREYNPSEGSCEDSREGC